MCSLTCCVSHPPQVRAYDKQALMPDALLGEARVNLSEQSLGDSSVAGSGGGANVQVCLRSLSFAIFCFLMHCRLWHGSALHTATTTVTISPNQTGCLLVLAADISCLQEVNMATLLAIAY
jgi:hypothetical protein